MSTAAIDPMGCPCPYCGVILNFHVTPDGKDSNPAPGDVTTCSVCNSFLIFAPDLSLLRPTEGEKAIIFRSFDQEFSN